MTIVTNSVPSSAPRAATNAVRSMLGSRRGLIVLGAMVLGLGLLFKWNWIVAVGIAPLLLSALPCVAMCALGLCMSKMAGGQSGSQSPSTDAGPDSTPAATAALQLTGPSSGLPNSPTADASPPA